MSRIILIAVIATLLLAGSVMATIFIVADPGGAIMSFRSDQVMKLTITSAKVVALSNDPNSIEIQVRLRVN